MANPTTNFGWQMPEPTDLVTDLPADFEVFGQAVDTDFVDLLGGTTGQVLSKTSGTDLDFTWTAPATGMSNPLTTTGDTIYSSSGTTPARLGIGSAGQVLTVVSGIPSWTTPATAITTATFRDEKSSGTPGGTFTTGSWLTRDLNTSQFNNITSASLASNQITLPAGTYNIFITAPCFGVGHQQARLYNITDSAAAVLGASNYTRDGATATSSYGLAAGTFTITGTKVFEVQHRCDVTGTSNGFGVEVSWGTEVYASVTIEKVA
jgi:hypothetical protein